ncbi:MAG: RagB/SusD family nutrient uptake outer membrane protein [Prevotella sp.]|nr:RagB/SusD family nutrient uptake outer membrane protein [Prevotella sp.]MBQ1646817.1 RagB/SusD family nutrient uptake outer membrane protein [Prevotella sp.]MBQ1701795.1 RagB/SusD family nutrient uptake outer membrane protein [Prevotella sp.]MBQ1800268.1 RagB/SusD family nutrient uptake outer membrane protein [Prevotella sp.]MBQ2214991.1 RagB/SusD family nutrient uptake outer membrane protein [Prevotella sp.]
MKRVSINPHKKLHSRSVISHIGIATLSLLTLILSSCSDMLSTESEMVEFERDNTLNHPTDSVYSVLGIIGKMQVIADRTVLLGEVRADLMETTEAASADLKRLANFNLSEDNKYNAVSDYYAVINNCNYYLAYVDTALQRRGRNIFQYEYAAVKAFRAWTYLQLAQIYGAVPLVLTPVMTEMEAQKAMEQEKKGIMDICQYFIKDLTPYAEVDLPRFGDINGMESQRFFIPMRALLGDLCLWAGQYQEAARWYHNYLTEKKNPILLNYSNRITWPSVSEFVRPIDSYSVTGTTEVLSFIPMEQRVFDGVVSDLSNVFNSTEENRNYFQLTPSIAMHQLSADQTFCIENRTNTQIDTIYVPKKGLNQEILVGDLRFYSNYKTSSVTRDSYSEYNADYQTIQKITRSYVPTYRRTMVYLRYAEALNRAGLPQSAFSVLKYGLCQENIVSYVDSLERDKAGELIAFDANVFTKENTIGIHSMGSGDSQINAYYTLPMPSAPLASKQDTINYQIPLVEDMIINEMALEGAFEGYRFYDLMRIALRRNDPNYLAAPISQRMGIRDENIYSLLMDTKNWYLPLK